MTSDPSIDPRDETIRAILQLAAPLGRAASLDAVVDTLSRAGLDMLGAAAVAVIIDADLCGGTPGVRRVASSEGDQAEAVVAIDAIAATPWGGDMVGSDRSTGVSRDDLDDAAAALLDALGAVDLDVHPLGVPDERFGCIVVAWSAHRRREGAEAALRARALRDLGTMAVHTTRLATQLNRLAQRDALTGLANRQLFVDRVERAVASAHRRHRNLAVLLVELRGLPTDEEAADAALVELAGRLSGALRLEDTVARVDASCFAVLLPELDDPAPALDVAAKVRDTVGGLVGFGEARAEVSSSIGVALSPYDSRDAEGLVSCAEIALCRARALGRDHIVRYEPALLADRERRSTLEGELRDAIVAASIGSRELLVEYQPQVDLADGRISGLEALVRWNHPTRGRLVPTEFLGAAEDSGLVVALDTWVLTRVVRDLEMWRAAGLTVPRVGLNVSTRDLRDDAFVDTLADVLGRTGLPAGSLELEVADGLPIDDDGVAEAALVRVRELGVTIAIDDFGTRRSELGRLATAPVDAVKVDRRFVGEILTVDGSGLLVDGIVALVAALGLRSIACGVETDDQRAHLAAIGCDAVQGWLFAEPIDASLIERLLSNATVRVPGTV